MLPAAALCLSILAAVLTGDVTAAPTTRSAPGLTETPSGAPAAAVQRTIASADGVPIHIVTQGAGSPPIVFVHGWSGEISIWEAQIRHFAGTHQVTAIDLAGHGASGRNRKDWTVPAYGADVAAVLESLDLHGVILVGHSMGGSVITAAAAIVPQRIALLVPVDSLHDVEQKPTQEQIAAFLAPFRADFPKTVSEFIRGFFPEGSDPALVDRVVTMAAAAPAEIAVPSLQALFGFDQAGTMERVRTPFHAINSEKHPTRLEINRRHAARFDVTLMPGVGHFPMLEKPEQFNAILEKVVAQATNPGPTP